jgi:hypothetical protein
MPSPRHGPVDYRNMDRNRDFVSENATRSIFGWLRVDGYAVDEKEIWKHDWLEIPESDEEEEQSDDSSRNIPRSSSYGETWVSEMSVQSDTHAVGQGLSIQKCQVCGSSKDDGGCLRIQIQRQDSSEGFIGSKPHGPSSSQVYRSTAGKGNL